MKFLSAACVVLYSTGALAAPGTAARRQRAAERIAGRDILRSSNTLQPVESNEVEVANKNGTAHVEYSSNWAGAVLIGTGYTSVKGTFVVPTPKTPSGGSSSKEYSASAWVGIDGDTCATAILQTGIDFTVKGSSVSYDAWYEWYPDYVSAYDFSGIPISAGDTITVTVTASSKSAGTAVIENVSTGKTVSHSFSGESDSLCETNAEWIVEDYSSGGSLVSFADFGSVEFTGATVNGAAADVSGATIIDIQQNGAILTDCSTGSSTVTCEYSN
ncbi:peptidase A4 family-domain-containing protein [Whalleya microplaca]|nr:peptidase A4 family-domain-containing protein [Whalleya microplaca]